MGFTGIAHVAFVVSDMDRAEAFYVGILGLRPLFDLKDGEGKPWIRYFSLTEKQFLELFFQRDEGAAREAPTVGYSHCCFTVEDIHATVREIEERGGVLDRPIKLGADGNYQCWIRDPDRNRIEIMQMLPDALQSRG